MRLKEERPLPGGGCGSPLPAGASGPRAPVTRRPGGRSARPPPFSDPRRHNATASPATGARTARPGRGRPVPTPSSGISPARAPRRALLSQNLGAPAHPGLGAPAHPGLGSGDAGELGLRMGAPSPSRRPPGRPGPGDGQRPPDVTRAGTRRLAAARVTRGPGGAAPQRPAALARRPVSRSRLGPGPSPREARTARPAPPHPPPAPGASLPRLPRRSERPTRLQCQSEPLGPRAQ